MVEKCQFLKISWVSTDEIPSYNYMMIMKHHSYIFLFDTLVICRSVQICYFSCLLQRRWGQKASQNHVDQRKQKDPSL